MEGVFVLKLLYSLLFICALLIAGCGGGDNKASAPANNKPADKASASASTEQKTNPQIEKIKKNLRFGVVEGKEYQLVKYNENIDVTVINLSTTQQLPYRNTMGEFLLIELYVHNNGNVPIMIQSGDFILLEVEKNGKEFNIKREYAIDIVNLTPAKTYFKNKREKPSALSLNPGLETIIVLPFEVPKGFDYENKGRLIMRMSPNDKGLSMALFPKTKDRVLKHIEQMAKAKQ
jgi:hypothetical protein